MNTDELKYFVEAAKEQNLSRAARTLGSTQSTLSYAIRRLETEFDCKLFSKSGKQLKLTSQGRKFLERAEALLKNIHELKSEVSSGETPLIGHIKAGGTLGFPVELLTKALLTLNNTPKTVLEITSMRSGDILKKVASKELDFGLCIEPQSYPNIHLSTIAISQSVVTVKKSHPLLKMKKGERLNALSAFPWARAGHLPGVAPCTSHPLFDGLKKQPKVRFYYDNYEIALQILLETDSWTLLPKVFTLMHPNLKIVLEEYTEPFKLALASHEDTDKKFVESLEEAVKTSARQLGW